MVGAVNPATIHGASFLIRSHSAWLAAVGAIAAGQVVETYILMRPVIEFAAYALRVDADPNALRAWFDRGTDKASKKTMRDLFANRQLINTIAAKDAQLSRVYERLYDHCVDAGSHPNPLSIFGSMEIDNDPLRDRVDYIHKQLHTPGIATYAATRHVGHAGYIALMILQHTKTFKARFELLGIKQELINMRGAIDNPPMTKPPRQARRPAPRARL